MSRSAITVSTAASAPQRYPRPSPFASWGGVSGCMRFTVDARAGWVSFEGASLLDSGTEEGMILSIRSDRIAEPGASAESAATSEDRKPAFQNRLVQPVDGSPFQVMSHWHHSSSLAMQDRSVNVAGDNP